MYFIGMNLSFVRLPTVITSLVLSFQEAKANLKLLVAKQLESVFFFTASVIHFSTNLAIFPKISSHYLFSGK